MLQKSMLMIGCLYGHSGFKTEMPTDTESIVELNSYGSKRAKDVVERTMGILTDLKM